MEVQQEGPVAQPCNTLGDSGTWMRQTPGASMVPLGGLSSWVNINGAQYTAGHVCAQRIFDLQLLLP